jgi:hypothetical protein
MFENIVGEVAERRAFMDELAHLDPRAARERAPAEALDIQAKVREMEEVERLIAELRARKS